LTAIVTKLSKLTLFEIRNPVLPAALRTLSNANAASVKLDAFGPKYNLSDEPTTSNRNVPVPIGTLAEASNFQVPVKRYICAKYTGPLRMI
jgi:hypothetical protein